MATRSNRRTRSAARRSTSFSVGVEIRVALLEIDGHVVAGGIAAPERDVGKVGDGRLGRNIGESAAAQDRGFQRELRRHSDAHLFFARHLSGLVVKNGIAAATEALNAVGAGAQREHALAKGNTDLAGNCYFYLGEIQFRQGNYQQAAKSYDQVLQNFPTGNKAASAQLKKGFSLLELGKQEDGVVELRHVIQRYPKSNEALQARERLRKLGVSANARPGQ